MKFDFKIDGAMPIPLSSLDEKNATPGQLVWNIVAQLMAIYDTSVREGSFEDFHSLLYDRIASDELMSEKTIALMFIEKTKGISDENLLVLERLKAAIYLSMYRCEQSERSEILNEKWYFAARANWWLGTALGTETALHEIARVAKKLPRSGGAGKSNLYLPLRTLAVSLATEKKFPSRRNAVLSIRDEVLRKAKELKINLSDQQAETTITGWIRHISFAGKQGTSASTDTPSTGSRTIKGSSVKP